MLEIKNRAQLVRGTRVSIPPGRPRKLDCTFKHIFDKKTTKSEQNPNKAFKFKQAFRILFGFCAVKRGV